MKVKARAKVVFCNGTTHIEKGPKITTKEARRAPKQVGENWERDRKQVTAGVMWDDEGRPEGIPADAHPIAMVLQTKAKGGSWTDIWHGVNLCACQVQDLLTGRTRVAGATR